MKIQRFLLLLLFTSFITISCSTETSKAKKRVISFILENSGSLEKSYKGGSWGELEPVINMISTDPRYRKLTDSVSFYKKRLEEVRTAFNLSSGLPEKDAYARSLLLMEELYNSKYLKNRRELDSLTKNHPVGITGYVIKHSYRIADSTGQVNKRTDTFILDKELVNVTGIE